jgi:urease accessory protein
MNAVPVAAIDAGAIDAGDGWQARLDLRFEAESGRTRLAHRRHHGPLMVQRVFYPEGASPAHAYLLHPPGGVVSGDRLQLEVDVRPAAHALLTTPAAGKFYRRMLPDGGRWARLQQTLQVNGGVLEWLPQENIFFPDTAARLSTEVRLTGSARFIGWEIGCLGLPASNATLGEGIVRQGFELWHDDAPLLLERVQLDRGCLQSRWGLAGHVALGTWLAFPAGERELALARAAVAATAAATAAAASATIAAAATGAVDCADLMLACTLVDGVLSCRGTASRADRLRQAFIDLWRALRPALVGRAAIAPRIWAT